MQRCRLGSLFFGTLLATAAVSSSFASSAPPQDSGLIKSPQASCAEKTAAAAEEQEGPRAVPCESRAEADDRSYLLETASPGATMTRQGAEIAIARLNPDFAARLAGAIREARASGLPSAGVFSAYRPPAFGIGGFSDKFKSLHAYGLAVDMSGIGEPGSKDAKLWHDIAGRHGIICPYGYDSRKEWNHCQATPIKSVVPDNPLRKTITAQGPLALEEMFKVGNAIIDDLAAAIRVAVAGNRAQESEAIRPNLVRAARVSASARHDRGHLHDARNRLAGAFARAARTDKKKMRILAADARKLEKVHRKSAEVRKTRDPRKAARA